MGRVLYVDDDVGLTLLVSRALGKLGHQVTTCNAASEALQAFTRQPRQFDLVLTDMSMPGLSGLELAQQILSIESDVHVVIATGCPDPNWASHARACGVREVIEKQASVEELARTVDRLLAQR